MTGFVDPNRLARAVWLEATRLGAGRYVVSGGRAEHEVDLQAPAGQRCDCLDYLTRGQLCKHLLCARLREGDPAVLGALRLLVPERKGPKAAQDWERAERRGGRGRPSISRQIEISGTAR